MTNSVRTNVYVDGFNLYYGALRSTGYKWLNILKLCENVLQSYHSISRIRYFTARVASRPNDPNQHVRQQVYLRALETLPNLSIHYGHYLSSRTQMPVADPSTTDPVPLFDEDGRVKKVEVIKTEEKGSDVNLAHFLVVDGFRQDYECAVVITNDSDLKTPVQFVRRELRLDVGVINPHKKPSIELKKVSKFCLSVTTAHLASSQFPRTLQDSQHRTITKPKEW